MPDHKSRAHALLSASAAHRWMECTPSAVLTADMPDETSPFAAEGTRAHEMAEAAIKAKLRGEEFNPDDPTIYKAVEPYVTRVIEDYNTLREKTADTMMFIEQRVDFSEFVPEGFGTADCIIISGHTLYVRDLKFGMGVKVYAADNPQARLYGLGALALFENLYDIQMVVNQIHQVRLDHFSEEVLSVDELYTWANEVLVPKAELATAGTGDFVPGEHCRFCKARSTCSARISASFEGVGKNLFPSFNLDAFNGVTVDITSLPDILEHAEKIEALIGDIKKKITDELMQGHEVPGFKLVEGRSLRKYSDDLAVAQRCISNGIPEALIYEKKLLGITELTKAVGGKKKFDSLLGDLIIKPAGKPTLAKADDKRPAINPASDFSDIDIKEAK